MVVCRELLQQLSYILFQRIVFFEQGYSLVDTARYEGFHAFFSKLIDNDPRKMIKDAAGVNFLRVMIHFLVLVHF